jgi:cystathionine beta-synthase
VEGLGYDFVPTVLDHQVIDKWYKTEDKESILMARDLVSKEGFLCGMSSGAAMAGAIKAAKDFGYDENHHIVVILPDTIRNYMSKFVNDAWMIERGFITPDAAQQDFQCLSMNRGTKPWFWDMEVSNLLKGVELEVIAAHPQDACKDVIKKMKLGGYDQMPVTDPKNGSLVGIVTVQQIIAKAAEGSIKIDEPIKDIAIKVFPKIRRQEKISCLAHLLQNSQYVALVEPLNGLTENSDSIVAILTHMDILNFFDI